MEFECTIIDKYRMTVYVEAESWEDAEDKINHMLASGAIKPTEDFDDADIDIEVCACDYEEED